MALKTLKSTGGLISSLGLIDRAGLGVQLRDSGVMQDMQDPNRYIIPAGGNLLSAKGLAGALSVQAKKTQMEHIKFNPERITTCH